MGERSIRVLVCGGRDFDDLGFVHRALDALSILAPFAVLIEGGATGADSLARTWAQHHGIPVITEPADWAAYGRRAGPVRNAKMVADHKPDIVVAFAGGPGTADMIGRARGAGVYILDFSGWPSSALSSQERR